MTFVVCAAVYATTFLGGLVAVNLAAVREARRARGL